MEYYGYVFAFASGLIVGSFLNVVVYRLHTGRSVNGFSHCLSCGRRLLWFDLVPVLSYIALRGRCRTCCARVPIHYVVGELLCGGLFLLVWHMFANDTLLLLLHFVLVSLLVVVLHYDLKHLIIPDEAVWGLLICAALIIGRTLYVADAWASVFIYTASGLVAAGFFASLWYFSHGRWMGLGDAKLALPLAVLVGPYGALGMVVFSFWIGAAIMLSVMAIQQCMRSGSSLRGKGTTRLRYFGTPLRIKSEIPFAPFLIAAFFLVYFFHVDVLTIISAVTL